MATVFESRFTDPQLASSIGAVANQVCCAFQFYQNSIKSNTQKIVFDFFPAKQERDNSLDVIDEHVHIIPVSTPKELQSLDEIAKLLTEKLTPIFSKNQDQFDAISTTITQSKLAGFTAKGDIKLSHKISPKKTRECKISFSITSHLEFLLVVLDKNNATETKTPIASYPASVANIDEIGAVKWTSEEQLTIARKKTKDFWIWSANEHQKINFKFYRAEIEEPKGLFDLGQMYLNGFIVTKDLSTASHYFKLSAAAGYKHAEKILAKLSILQ